MATVIVGLGSNIDPETNLRLGVGELRRRYGEVDVSAVYRSAAVGFHGADFLLLYDELIMDEGPVRVPREDVLEYSFVLRPLAELAPELVHPVTGKTMLEHWQEFDSSRHPLTPVDVVL